MALHSEYAAGELARIQATIGRPEIARVLFKPRVDLATVQDFTNMILSQLKIAPASAGVVCDFSQVPSEQIGPWATQLWGNAISELAAADEALGNVFKSGQGFVPTDPAAITLYKRSFAENFLFFAWIYGWGGTPGDATNCFTARIVSLGKVILIENLQSARNGKPGGWGLLDAVVEVIRPIASAAGQRVKTVATNARVEAAFRRRGFVDSSTTAEMEHSAKAIPLELPVTSIAPPESHSPVTNWRPEPKTGD